MSKKKPEKVWMFYGCGYARHTDKKPKIGTLDPGGTWNTKDGISTPARGWSAYWQVYADEDRAKVALFAAGFRACQAMYAEMFKEAESE